MRAAFVKNGKEKESIESAMIEKECIVCEFGMMVQGVFILLAHCVCVFFLVTLHERIIVRVPNNMRDER